MAGCISFVSRRLRGMITDYNRAVFVCSVTILTTSYTSVYPFTYLPDMILWFGYGEEDTGFYAGFVASAYFAGSLLFSYFGGWLSDRIGRKLILTFMVASAGVFCLLYGFCTNIYMAITIRLCDGVVNGLSAVVNAILYDHSNNDNQAFAASIVACSRAIGICLGPLIAGYLAESATKYPERSESAGLFGRFPYVTPSLLGFGLSLFAALVIHFALPSTVSGTDKHELLDDGDIELDVIQPTIDIEDIHHQIGSGHAEIENDCRDNDLHISSKEARNNDAPASMTANSKKEKTFLWDRYSMRHIISIYIEYFTRNIKNNNLFTICRHPGVSLILIIHTLFYFTLAGYWELLPVWLSTTRDLGGLGFTSGEIGLFTGTASFVGIVIQASFVLKLEKRLGAILSCMIFAFMLTVSMQLTTLTRLVDSEAAMWTIIYLNNTILSTAFPATLAMITVITNNCAPVKHVGAFNGIALTLAGLAGAVAPVVGGNIYSASTNSSIGAPIDPSTAFVFFGASIWFSTVAMYFLPRDLNSQHRNTKDVRNVDGLQNLSDTREDLHRVPSKPDRPAIFSITEKLHSAPPSTSLDVEYALLM